MQRLTISWRLYCLVLLSLVILGGAMTFSLFQSYASSERERKAGLAQMNDAALTVLKKYQGLEAAGTMTREQAQTEAKAIIAGMRYGEGTGYFWINDMTPRMVMHPIKPEMNGKDLTGDKDPNGKFLFVEFANTVKAQGKGFVDYYWPKPGFEQPQEKYSHVAGFAPWGWIIGTGVYVDDLHAMFRRDAINFGAIFAVGALVLIGGAAFVVRSVTRPIGQVKQVLQSIAAGEVGVSVPCTEQKNEIGEFLGTRGHEFGVVTGRKRRCGWFDAVLVRQAVAVNGIKGIALTKLDVLDGLDEIKVCTGYRLDGEAIDYLPASQGAQARVEPVYETLEGWKGTTAGARSWNDLPAQAVKYVRYIEELIGAPVALLSTSPERDDTILVTDPFQD